MSTALAIAGSPRALWYVTRGAGAVTLVGLTGTTALGVVGTLRWRTRQMPRFLLDALHRNLALVTVCVLAIHVLTAVIDGFAPIGLLDAVIPFHGSYRPLWLGFGALAFDLLLAVGITSLLRARLGHRAWRAVHWIAYACWPVALVHALGTGSDVRLGWMLVLGVLCLLTVLAAAAARLVAARDAPGPPRAAAAGGIVAALLAVAVWAAQGPLAHGWARRAGTPATLLASNAAATGVAVPASRTRSIPAPGWPARPFSAHVSGTVRRGASPDGSQAVLELPLTLSGGHTGTLDVRLLGQPLAGGGIGMTDSSVRLHAGGTYRGRVTRLEGTTLDALVSGGGHTLRLRIDVALDQTAGTASGTVHAAPADGASA